eukprot:8354836-Pyramimonas_sp.AAC.1
MSRKRGPESTSPAEKKAKIDKVSELLRSPDVAGSILIPACQGLYKPKLQELWDGANKPRSEFLAFMKRRQAWRRKGSKSSIGDGTDSEELAAAALKVQPEPAPLPLPEADYDFEKK